MFHVLCIKCKTFVAILIIPHLINSSSKIISAIERMSQPIRGRLYPPDTYINPSPPRAKSCRIPQAKSPGPTWPRRSKCLGQLKYILRLGDKARIWQAYARGNNNGCLIEHLCCRAFFRRFYDFHVHEWSPTAAKLLIASRKFKKHKNKPK